MTHRGFLAAFACALFGLALLPAAGGAEDVEALQAKVAAARGEAESLTSRLQAAQSEARSFDFTSLGQLQAWSDVPAGQNLFDSMVVFENYPISEPATPGAPDALSVSGPLPVLVGPEAPVPM